MDFIRGKKLIKNMKNLDFEILGSSALHCGGGPAECAERAKA